MGIVPFKSVPILDAIIPFPTGSKESYVLCCNDLLGMVFVHFNIAVNDEILPEI